MNEVIDILKKQWFVVLIAIILLAFAVFSIWDTNKGKLAGKSADGKDVVASLSDVNITADDIFTTLLTQAGDDLLFTRFQDAVADEAIETTSDIKSEAKLQAEAIEANAKKSNPTGYKDALQKQLDSLGYEDLEEFCMLSVKAGKLQTSYIEDHMEELFTPIFKEKKSRIVSHILVKMVDSKNPTEEEAAKVKSIEDAFAAGTSFEDIAKKFSDDPSASVGGLVGYADSDSGLVEDFKTTALGLEKGVVSDWVKVASTNYQGWHKIIVLEDIQEGIQNYENETVKTTLYKTIANANEGLAQKIIWEKSKELEVTYANDDIKKQLMDYMGITE